MSVKGTNVLEQLFMQAKRKLSAKISSAIIKGIGKKSFTEEIEWGNA